MRRRYFCSVCGVLCDRPVFDGPYARCRAHASLPREQDLIPPDPLETLPLLAAHWREDTKTIKERED